jgi:ABC-type transporter Mla MlaB component
MSIARRSGPSLVRVRRSSELRAPRKRSIEFEVAEPIARADIPLLCNALERLLESSSVGEVVFDLGRLVRPDAVTVDALARLQLTARRLGFSVRLRKASPELRELIAFMGLRAAMRAGRATGR